jgi:hypothetical protein
LAVRDTPKASEMKMMAMALGGDPAAGAGVFAIWVPAKAKNRNRNVPTNSPSMATRLFLVLSGLRSIGRAPPGEPGVVAPDCLERTRVNRWPCSDILRCGNIDARDVTL